MQAVERVTLCEVGTRDGFQIEPEFIPTEQKIEVVDRLSEAGVPRIEVTSFVHPKAIPQLRDAEAVMAAIRRRPGTRYAALVPNDASRRALERNGYRPCALFRRDRYLEGRWHDLWVGEILREEWDALQEKTP